MDRKQETWGLFAALGLNNKASGRFGIGTQLACMDSSGRELAVVNDFLDRFQHCRPIAEAPPDYGHQQRAGQGRGFQRMPPGDIGVLWGADDPEGIVD